MAFPASVGIAQSEHLDLATVAFDSSLYTSNQIDSFSVR
jgi:hypothetical protein